MTALAAYRDWMARSSGPLVVLALLAATGVLVGAAIVLPIAALSAVLGALAGLTLFLAGYTTALRLLPAPTRDRLDPKANLPLPTRRAATAAVAVVWLTVLLLVGRHLPEALGGTLNVAVLLALFTVWSPTPAEAQAQAEALAVAQAQREAEAQARADDDEYRE